jgi:hypothetical protein
MSRVPKATPQIPKGTALGASVKVGAPGGVAPAPKAPLITRKQNVGLSNLTKERFGAGPHILGNHK